MSTELDRYEKVLVKAHTMVGVQEALVAEVRASDALWRNHSHFVDGRGPESTVTVTATAKLWHEWLEASKLRDAAIRAALEGKG